MFLCKSLISDNKLPELKYLIHAYDKELYPIVNCNKNGCENLLTQYMKDLTCYNGYLQNIYNICTNNMDWLIGWELSKIINSKILNIQNDSDLNITGFLANTSSDFISGFLYYASTIYPIKHISCKFLIYNENEIFNINTDGKLLMDNKQFKSTKINIIDTIDYHDTKFLSANICRYINNTITANSLYLNFSIIKPIHFDTNITTILPSLFNLHETYGIVLTCFDWCIEEKKDDKKKDDKKKEKVRENYVSDNVILFIYTFSCMYNNINLIWLPCDNQIWALGYNRNKSFDKITYIDLMESNGYDVNSIKSEYKIQFENIKKECLKFNNLINKEKNKIQQQLISNKEYLIKTWLENNEKHLENINIITINE